MMVSGSRDGACNEGAGNILLAPWPPAVRIPIQLEYAIVRILVRQLSALRPVTDCLACLQAWCCYGLNPINVTSGRACLRNSGNLSRRGRAGTAVWYQQHHVLPSFSPLLSALVCRLMHACLRAHCLRTEFQVQQQEICKSRCARSSTEHSSTCH
jgi:hypothetical protein